MVFKPNVAEQRLPTDDQDQLSSEVDLTGQLQFKTKFSAVFMRASAQIAKIMFSAKSLRGITAFQNLVAKFRVQQYGTFFKNLAQMRQIAVGHFFQLNVNGLCRTDLAPLFFRVNLTRERHHTEGCDPAEAMKIGSLGSLPSQYLVFSILNLYRPSPTKSNSACFRSCPQGRWLK